MKEITANIGWGETKGGSKFAETANIYSPSNFLQRNMVQFILGIFWPKHLLWNNADGFPAGLIWDYGQHNNENCMNLLFSTPSTRECWTGDK